MRTENGPSGHTGWKRGAWRGGNWTVSGPRLGRGVRVKDRRKRVRTEGDSLSDASQAPFACREGCRRWFGSATRNRSYSEPIPAKPYWTVHVKPTPSAEKSLFATPVGNYPIHGVTSNARNQPIPGCSLFDAGSNQTARHMAGRSTFWWRWGDSNPRPEPLAGSILRA